MKQGLNVVLDDSRNFQTLETRKSLVQKVKETISSCQVICIVVKPSGMVQCLWANEWALAERSPLKKKGKPVGYEVLEYPVLKAFYADGYKGPSKEEGFDDVLEKPVKLYCNRRQWEFNHQVWENCCEIDVVGIIDGSTLFG